MNIKRIICILLTLVMVLTLTACGSEPAGGSSKSEVDIDTMADEKRADFPNPAGGYHIVLSYVQMDKKTLDVYLGKMIVAYDHLNDEEFCQYVHELNQANDEYLVDTYGVIDGTSQMLMQEGTAEAAENARTLVNFNLQLTTYRTNWKSWDVEYLSTGIDEDAPTYKELKDDTKVLINDFANMLYGKDMV